MAEPLLESTTPRRKFLDWLLGTSFGALVAAVLYPAVRYLIPPVAGESSAASVGLPLKPDEIPANTGKIFKFGSKPGLLIKTSDNQLRAFSATCTHLGC